MNQFADPENRKSQIAYSKSPDHKSSDKWQVTSDKQGYRFRIVSIENPKSKIQNCPMIRSADQPIARPPDEPGLLGENNWAG
jgi:hypothetical protein